MAQSDHDKIKHFHMLRRQLHLQKIHPSAFVTVGLVLWILVRGCGGNRTWNSKGAFIQINAVADGLVLQEHAGPVARTAELNNVTLQLPDILSPPFHVSAHFTVRHPNPVTITHSDCTVHGLSGSLCYTGYLEQFVFNIMCVQVMSWLPSNRF